MADFERYKYETDPGVIMLCRLDEETFPFAGPEPAGTVDLDASAVASNTRRRGGVKPRFATLGREIGTPPDQFMKYKRVPLLTKNRENVVRGQIGATVTVAGEDWEILGVTPEERN
jgi:hypothetical protein